MPIDLAELQTLHYDVHDAGEHGVAVVTLDRPESRNAQNKRMTYELNACFDDASRRTDVKVILLQADGPHFSSGHDMRDREPHVGFDVVSTSGGYSREGQEGQMAWEEEVYFQMCWRWRNIPKPVIAAAQGKTIAGGLMLLWVADVIIAADDAQFSDPVVGMGVNGVEYFAHPWELGARKAKELLFTGDFVSAEDARLLGMVNQVVPAAELRDDDDGARPPHRPAPELRARSWPRRASTRRSRRRGSGPALRAAFSIQHLAHAHNRARFGIPVDPGPGTA